MVTTKRRGPLVAFGLMTAVMGCGTLAAQAAQAAQGDATSQLRALIDREWEQRFADDPVFATFNGRHDRDHLLSEVTVAEFERQTNDTRAFLEELATIDRAALPESEQVNYDVFQWQLQSRVEEFEVAHWRLPINSDSGFHTEFPRLAGGLRFASAKDYENYIARLRALPKMFDQYMALMRDGVVKGMTVPRVVLENYDVTISSHVVDDAAKSLFYKPFEKFAAAVGAADQERLRKEGADAILGAVVPAYRKFSEFMAKEYIPAARTTIGASDMPGGKDYYAQRIRTFTTLDFSADQIHQIGLDEVARIRKEMDAIIAKVEFKGTFPEFLAFLRTDPRFYAKTPHELLAAASFHAKKMDGKLPSLFKTLPRLPYGVEPVPDYLAPVYTGGRYSPAAPGSTQSGNYWVNTYALDKRPLYTLEALTLHEAVPGHHLQIALAQELQDVPEFRRDLYISAFGEGWGLYSERLGLDAGFYTDP